MATEKKILITIVIPVLSLISLVFSIIGGGGLIEYTNRIKDFFSGKSRNITTVIIDPGHGGRDPGVTAVYYMNGGLVKLLEKDITLQLAMILSEKIKQVRPKINVVFTREEDISLTLEERADISNAIPLKNGKTALFISLHANNAPENPRRNGYEIWYSTYADGYYRQTLVNMSESIGDDTLNNIFRKVSNNSLSTKTEAFAQLLYVGLFENIYPTINRNRILEEEFFVLRNNSNIAVILETGYLSNRADAELLADENHLNKIADGIIKGIQYFEEYLSAK